MKLSVIKIKEQFKHNLDCVDEQFEKKLARDTPDGKKLEVALMLIKQFEDEYHPIPLPDPSKVENPC